MFRISRGIIRMVIFSLFEVGQPEEDLIACP
jgi:hypothetical protein